MTRSALNRIRPEISKINREEAISGSAETSARALRRPGIPETFGGVEQLLEQEASRELTDLVWYVNNGGWTTEDLARVSSDEFPQDADGQTSPPISFYSGADIDNSFNARQAFGGGAEPAQGDDVEDTYAPLRYVVLNSDVFDPSAGNSGLLSIWMRGMPTTDISRAYPFLRVSLLERRVDTPAKLDSYVPTLSWEWSLGQTRSDGRQVSWKREGEGTTGERRAFIASQASRRVPEGLQSQYFTALPDVFNAPQTFRARGEALNPSLPQLGLIDLSIEHAPTKFGLISVKTASLTIKLFDRSRMKDIAPMISPQYFGNVAFEVEWGWGCAVSEVVSTPYTKLLDALKTTEIYTLTSSNFSFVDDGSVNIDLRLAFRPARDLTETTISHGHLFVGNDGLTEIAGGIEREAQELIGIIRSLRGEGGESEEVDVRNLTFLNRFSSTEDVFAVANDSAALEQINQFIEANRSAPDGSPNKQLADLLRRLFQPRRVTERE